MSRDSNIMKYRDLLEQLRIVQADTGRGEGGRIVSIAITQLENSMLRFQQYLEWEHQQEVGEE